MVNFNSELAEEMSRKRRMRYQQHRSSTIEEDAKGSIWIPKRALGYLTIYISYEFYNIFFY